MPLQLTLPYNLGLGGEINSPSSALGLESPEPKVVCLALSDHKSPNSLVLPAAWNRKLKATRSTQVKLWKRSH